MKFIVFGTCRSKCLKKKRRKCKPRFIASLGAFTEQRRPAVPSLQRRHYPRGRMCGDLILNATLTATQKVLVTLTVVDGKGNPAVLDGPVDFSTDNSDILELTPGTEGNTCTVAAVGPLGQAKVFAHGDADLGTGVKPIIGFAVFDVIAGEAKVIQLQVGTPTEQEEAVPV